MRIFGLALYFLLFSFLLWQRYARLYAGEELSETEAPARRERRAAPEAADERDTLSFLPPQVLAVFRKELL